MTGATNYTGILRGLTIDGRYVAIPGKVAVALREGVGLVSATEDGEIPIPDRAAWRLVSRVWYWRRRKSGTFWRHDTSATLCAMTTRGPVFRPANWAAPAYVCPMIPGDFICGG